MAITSKVLAAAATLAVAGGLSTMGTLPAGAATPQRGPHCIQIFSAKFGTNANPGFVETVFQGPRSSASRRSWPLQQFQPGGDLIAMHPASGTLVAYLFAAGLVSAAVNSHDGSETAVQIEYAPLGKHTGLC